MEPERKIEKLLRAYAKKRRADTSDVFKLHPATRRRLQAEVARNKPRPDGDEADLSLWELFRRQWAFLSGFAILIFFVATLFLPGLSSAKKKSQGVAALNNLKQIGLAAQMAAEENNGKLPVSLDALTNLLGSDKVLTDAESGKPFVYVAAGENLDGLPSNSVLAYSPADKKERAVLFADGRVELVKSDQFTRLTNRGLSQLIAADDSERRQPADMPATMTVASGNVAASPPVKSEPPKSEADQNETKLADTGLAARSARELAINQPAAPAPGHDRLDLARQAEQKDFSTQTNLGQFASTGLGMAFSSQNSFKNTIEPAKAAPVLANFQLQQNGNSIRVVDADGSVYDGSVLVESTVASGTTAAAAAPPATLAAPAEIAKSKAVAVRDESQTAQNYSFRVAGMNQTLKQNVVFTGNLLAIPNATGKTQQTVGGGSQIQSAFNQSQAWPNSRIAGTAVVADTNHIQIDAVPLEPQ